MNREIKIVMYHYVRDLQASEYPAIKGLDVKIFEKQMEYLREHYTILRMEDVIEAVKSGDNSKLPKNGVLLTFDDGYIDHYEVVYPILKRYGAQGSFFPNAMAVEEHKLLTVNRIHFILAAAETGTVQNLVQECFSMMDEYRSQGVELQSNEELYREYAIPNRWDPAEVIFVKRLLQNALPEEIRTEMAKKLFAKYVGAPEDIFAGKLYMNKEQMLEMKRNGMFFGLHGYDHYWLSKLPEEKMKNDIDKARNCFADVIDRDCYVMNYPYGDFSDAVLHYIKENGCIIGLTTVAETAKIGTDNPFMLPRYDANDVYPRGERV
jgi:peptidoglycan/xylan/chitin deacetylase (PgdA/CDA1 family)